MAKSSISEEETEKQVWEYAEKVGEKDIRDIAGKADRISGFFIHVDVLRKYMDDAATVFSLLKDRVSGKYTLTPWRTVSALAAAILYMLAPLDAIADFIPFMGYIDDAAVFAFALNFARLDLNAYREWKKSSQSDPCATPDLTQSSDSPPTASQP